MSLQSSFAEIDEQFAKDRELKREDVAKLEEWQLCQSHLPKPLHPIETALFLHSCYYNNELAKQCIDNYYTFRTHCPEFFAKRDPLGPEVQMTLDTIMYMALPQLTSDGYMVFYGGILDRNPNKFNLNAAIKACDMILQLMLKQGGCQKGHIGIIDLQGATMMHLLKCSVLTVKKAAVFMQTAQPLRIKSIHFVNGVSFMDKILALIRPFLEKDLQNALYSHFGDNATIHKYVPKEMLPIECGGSKFCARDYYINVIRGTVENHTDYFKMEEDQVADEAKRLGKPINTGHLFGVEGTFKKLDID